MTYLVDHPGATGISPEVAAFDTEAAAEAWAQRLTARGVARVVVYYVAEAALEPVCGAAGSQVDQNHTDVIQGRNGTIQGDAA